MESPKLSTEIVDSAIRFAKSNPEWFRKNCLTLDGLIDTLYILEKQDGDSCNSMR